MVNSELKTFTLPFPNERGERKIWVYIPSHSEDEKLPVIYMTDGQNLFDEESTEYGSWNVISAVENEQNNTGLSAVIVGIDNGNIYRDSELTPKCIGEIQHRDYFNDIFSPEGEVFDSFLTDTVIPYIENNFPVKKNKESVSVCAFDGMDALLATVMMPTGIPVATVAVDGAANAAILAIEMLALSDDTLAEKLEKMKADMEEGVAKKDEAMQLKVAEL